MRRFTILWVVLFLLAPLGTRIHAEQSALNLFQIGRGDIHSVVWHPQNTYLLVTTDTGAWIYTPELKDVTYLPDAHMATLSPNGRYIAGVDDSHHMRLWDGSTFEPLTSPDRGYFRRIWTLAWSNDSRYIAASGNNGEDLTYVWDMTTPKMDMVVATRNAGDDLLWSPQDSILAIHNFPDGRFVLMGVGSSVQHQIAANANHIVFQDEKHILVIQTTDVNVEATRWSIATGEPLAKTWFYSLSAYYSHSGQALAVGKLLNVSILNAATNENQLSLDISFGSVEVMAWSHNDHWLAAGAYNFGRSQAAGVLLINTLTHQVEHQLSGLWQAVNQLAWSSDDRFLAAVDVRQQLLVYDVSSGEIRASSQAHTLVGQTLAWNSDGTILAVAASSTGISLWDTQHMQPIHEFHDDGSPVTSIKWQPHGNYIAVQERDASGFSIGPLLKAQIWDALASENTNLISRFKLEPDKIMGFWDWSADGKQLAAIVSDELYIWDVATGDTKTHFASAYQHLYLGLEDIRWSQSGRYIIMLMDGHGTGGSYIYSIEAKNDGLAYAELYRGAIVWSPKDELVSLSWGTWADPTPPTSVDVGLSRLVAPNFSTLASDPSGKYFALKGLTQNAQQGFLSPYGHYVAAIDGSGSGMVWDATTGLPITMLADAAQVIWSPDETQLAVQRLDGSVWLLDSKGGIRQQLPISASLQKPEGSFYWSPDSRTLAHLHNGVIDLWRLN